MRLEKSFLVNVILAVIAAFLIFFFSQKEFLKRLELTGIDFFFRLRGPLVCNRNIVVVEINDSDIAKIGGWPWERSWHAAMIKVLSELGAKCVFFDVVFSEPSSEKDDALLEEAIKQAKNIYLPFVFKDSASGAEKELMPLRRFFSYVRGIGAANVFLDIDGTSRSLPIVYSEKGRLTPHIALKLAMDYEGLEIKEINPGSLILSSPGKEVKIPLIEGNKMFVNWLGKWGGAFKRYSFLEVLAGYKDFLEAKKPEINIDDFKGSICLVGITALGVYDRRATPFQGEYPGVGIIATAVDNIIAENFLYSPPQWINLMLLCLLSLMPSFLIFGERPFKETASVFLIGGIYFLISFLLFKNGIRIDFFNPLFGLSISYVMVGTYNFVRAVAEKQIFFKLSVIDELSGLHNIRFFRKFLWTEILMARSNPAKKFIIIMADIDRFKQVNDAHGHQVGDLVIKKVADIFKVSVHSSDIVARYGGDEIIALLRGSSLKNGLKIAERIGKNVENSVTKDIVDLQHKVTISLGLAVFQPGDDIYSIIRRADKALYRAKEMGRNRVYCLEDVGVIS
ncbi:MAG: CHASE2 domain-containing protein [Candidatus Omnitrophota bacterium]